MPDEGRVRHVDGRPMNNVFNLDLGVGIQRRREVQPFVSRPIAVPEKADEHEHLWWGGCRIGPQTFNERVLAIQFWVTVRRRVIGIWLSHDAPSVQSDCFPVPSTAAAQIRGLYTFRPRSLLTNNRQRR
jgi:hypothetical protein